MRIAIAAVVLLALAGPVLAQTQNRAPDRDRIAIPQSLQDRIARAPEQMLEVFLRRFHAQQVNGVVTRNTYATQELINKARLRADAIADALAHDLDGDLRLSKAEIDRQRPFLNVADRAHLAAMMAFGDRDQDGRLSLNEMVRFETSTLAEKDDTPQIQNLMMFDLNRDGRLREQEIIAAVRQIARRR